MKNELNISQMRYLMYIVIQRVSILTEFLPTLPFKMYISEIISLSTDTGHVLAIFDSLKATQYFEAEAC